LPAIAILLLGTYRIGKTVLTPTASAIAAVLANFYPFVLWLSRETLIDYWLMCSVCGAFWLLLKTEKFSHRWWSILFGFACGLGMLTKFSFAFFIAAPFVWAARRNLRNALLAIIVGILICGPWYFWSIPALIELSHINAAGGRSEGDPAVLSWQGLMFYWRVLEGYQLFLPLFIAFIFGAFRLAREFESSWTPIVLWLVGSWVAFHIFQNKDPRYTAPLLPAIALITAKAFEGRRILITMLLPFLVFQHYLVSFGIARLPDTVVLQSGLHGPLSWDWQLFTQKYFGLWGPPSREHWPIDRVLDQLPRMRNRPLRLGLVPDIPRFDHAAFRLQIALRRMSVIIHSVHDTAEASVNDNDFVLAGTAIIDRYSAPNARAIGEYINVHSERFRLVETIVLPNGEVVSLYAIRTN
jgi:hypothetical protein